MTPYGSETGPDSRDDPPSTGAATVSDQRFGRYDLVEELGRIAVVARAVHHAHQRGILHRDIKPGNILLGPAGEAFISDFGLAKWLDRESRLTVSQAMMGTPDYVAPELIAKGANHLTVAADIYALGAVLYELLAGQPPFKSASITETLRRIGKEAPPTLSGGPLIWRSFV